MPRKQAPAPTDNLQQCLEYIRRRGGSVQLHSISYSLGVVETLLKRGLVKITNTGSGIYVELNDAA